MSPIRRLILPAHACDLLDRLTKVYMSPDTTFPVPQGPCYIVRYQVERIGGEASLTPATPQRHRDHQQQDDADRAAHDAVADGLARRPVAALSDILRDHPLQQGLAELVGYLALRDGVDTTVDGQRQDDVAWTGDDGVDRVASVPRVAYSRAGASRPAQIQQDDEESNR